MKKVLLGLLIVGFIAFAAYGVANQPKRITDKVKSEEYSEIMDVDLDYQYPENPTDVVKAYGRIEHLIYSYKFEGKYESRLEDLIYQQMKLMDDELIEYSGGKEKILLSTKESCEKLLDDKKKVIDVQYQTSADSTLDDNGNLVKFVNVIYYFNAAGGDNVYRCYALRRDSDKRWKIFTYSDIDPFVIK